MDQYDYAACGTDVGYAIRQLRVHGDIGRALDALERVAERLGMAVVVSDAECRKAAAPRGWDSVEA